MPARELILTWILLITTLALPACAPANPGLTPVGGLERSAGESTLPAFLPGWEPSPTRPTSTTFPTDTPYAGPTFSPAYPDLASPGPYPGPSTPQPYPGPSIPQANDTPTPIPTPVSVPTNTPPAVLSWPTPEPTPLAAVAETARRFVTAQAGVTADSLRLEMELRALRPSTGEELWIGRFIDISTGRSAWVQVDTAGQPAFLPDFSAVAREQLAQARNIPLEQVEVASAVYTTFPFSRQVAWLANLFDSQNGEWMRMAFDLDGRPVDIQALQQAESDARQGQCGKLYEDLYRSLLLLPPEATRLVEIYWLEGSDPAAVINWLEATGLAYQSKEISIQATLSKEAIYQVAALDPVSHIGPGYADQTVALDSNLLFSFEEAGGNLVLRMRTEKIYGCSNYPIDARLDHPGDSRWLITVRGILRRVMCETALGPAEWETTLGALDGEYELVFEYAGTQDRYRLTVTSRAVRVEVLANAFTWPRYSQWLRLPPGTVWFVAQACQGTALATPVPIERSVYREKLKEFFAAVESLGLEPLIPEEGIYSNRDFIPPWPAWHLVKGDRVEIPLDENRSSELHWPEIRYFKGSGEPGQFSGLIENYRSQSICIGVYPWTGE